MRIQDKIKLDLKRLKNHKKELTYLGMLTMDVETLINVEIDLLKGLLEDWKPTKCVICKKLADGGKPYPKSTSFVHRRCLPEYREIYLFQDTK